MYNGICISPLTCCAFNASCEALSSTSVPVLHHLRAAEEAPVLTGAGGGTWPGLLDCVGSKKGVSSAAPGAHSHSPQMYGIDATLYFVICLHAHPNLLFLSFSDLVFIYRRWLCFRTVAVATLHQAARCSRCSRRRNADSLQLKDGSLPNVDLVNFCLFYFL